MGRLLVVSYAPIASAGGSTARWRSFSSRLPALGWPVEVVSSRRGARSDLLQAGVGDDGGEGQGGSGVSPLRRLLERRRGNLPLSASTLWAADGSWGIRRRMGDLDPDLVLATGPQMVAPLAARLAVAGTERPLVVELRDLWAGNPAHDRGGGRVPRLERWVLGRARRVIVPTEQAAAKLRERYPEGPPVSVVPNGFEPALLEMRAGPGSREIGGHPREILYSGSLPPERPLGPLLAALERRRRGGGGGFRLRLQGYAAPTARAMLAASPLPSTIDPPVDWEMAVRAMAAADVLLVVQSAGVGDETAIAAKVYEYLALGKPILCLSDGGATEALLRELGQDRYLARLDRPETIDRALAALGEGQHEPVDPERLEPYRRDRLASRMAEALELSLDAR